MLRMPLSRKPKDIRGAVTTVAESSQTNATALRAIEILLLFNADKPVWTSNEIADRLDMPRSTAYRYLASLRETGMIESNEGSQYSLGSRILALARVAR